MNKLMRKMLTVAVVLFSVQVYGQRFYFDAELEEKSLAFLTEAMTEYEVSTGQAIVMDTKTGRVKARVSLMKGTDSHIPYHDGFCDEWTYPHSAADYLALMATGKVTPDTEFDTGNGVWNDIYDHNWNRGGYGRITLERALGVKSIIALQMAIDTVFAKRAEEYDMMLYRYHDGYPERLEGILTFYNAVANGGRMVKPISQGRTVVIDEQFESKAAIELLQKALRESVASGIFKKVDIPGANVAASGRTFKINSSMWRMELCGYFPAEAPQHTIMVIMEKDGLPIGAGSMCGRVFAKIVNYFMEKDFKNRRFPKKQNK